MVRIAQGKPGRRDGGYARMFDDADLGELISRIHATSIRAGTELEHIVQRESEANGTAIKDLDAFLKNGRDGVFLAAKPVIKKSKGIQFPGAEPDYLVFVREGVKRHCYVIELKDGDQFDTKKSSGEVASLTNFATTVGAKLPYSTEIKICSFNQDDKDAIVQGFKQAINVNQVWTGKEFCELLGFDYDRIVNERKTDAEANRRYLVERFLAIPSIRRMLDAGGLGSDIIPERNTTTGV